MGTGNDSILDTYLYETNTLLEQLDTIVLEAEKADTFSEDDVNEIFRIMHTIKGSSAMMEFNALMTVATGSKTCSSSSGSRGWTSSPKRTVRTCST